MVFARAPVPGAAKTRLIPLLGAAGAAALHERLVTRALATAVAAAVGPVALWCAPDDSHPFLRAAAARHGASLHPQAGHDLGARLVHGFAGSLPGRRRVLCIGADCPALTPQHLRDAAAALDTRDAVFVPAEDGGYALVGLTRPQPGLFADVAWGGTAVMAQTRARLRALGLTWHELPTLWDVDRPEDVQRLQQSGLLDDAAA